MGADLDLFIEKAKSDPRMKKMKGEDYEDTSSKSDDGDGDEGGLDEVFSSKQAAAIRAYVTSCK